jgi:lipid-binding SYLF domain-containing protein
MNPLFRLVVTSVAVSFAASAAAQVKETERLEKARDVVHDLMGTAEGIPRDLLQKAHCVAIVPGVKKAAFGIGARWGKGAVLCRTEGGHGPWGPPLMLSLGGPSYGLQIGAQSADFMFLIMNPRGIDQLLKSKVTLGADVSVAAGPIGRTAEAATDVKLDAEILTYSRSRGLFAGVSLEGAVIQQDKDANRRLYGQNVDPQDLLLRAAHPTPPAARGLVATLRDLSPQPAKSE